MTPPPLNKSAKNISGVCYDTNLENLKNAFRDLQACYIVHDKDEKETHVHFLISLSRSRRLSDVSSYLKKWLSGNIFLESCIDKSSAYKYLTHINAPEKYQYHQTEIIFSGTTPDFWESDEPEKEDKILSAFNDLISGMPLSDCSRKYGRDFIIHYGHIKSLLTDCGAVLSGGCWYFRDDLVNFVYESRKE